MTKLSTITTVYLFDADHGLAADAELVLDGGQLRLEHVILLAQLDHPLLEDHVVEPPLLPGPLGRLVVAPPPVPVALVLLVVRDELALFALREELLALQVRRQVEPGRVRFPGTGRFGPRRHRVLVPHTARAARRLLYVAAVLRHVSAVAATAAVLLVQLLLMQMALLMLLLLLWLLMDLTTADVMMTPVGFVRLLALLTMITAGRVRYHFSI